MKKTAVITAIAALAVPAAALAAQPDNPGQQGRDNAAAKRQANTNSTTTKWVGFTLKGLLVTGQTFPAFTAVGENFTLNDPALDLISANRHARKALDIEPSEIEGTSATPLDLTNTDQFKLNVVGITDAGTIGSWNDDLAAGDSVKLIGKVERTRTKEPGEKPTFDYGAVNIRKVVVTRGGDA
jgi:hypothetical protein